MKQSIQTKNIMNARELGGYINKEGKRIKKGLLIRSANLSNLTKEDYDILVNTYNLKKVFDFRASDERAKNPDDEIEGCTNYWIPILDESNPDENFAAIAKEYGNDPFRMFMGLIESGKTFTMYIDMMTSKYGQSQYSKFLKEVINTKEGAVLWHCSAGKDRTGVAALLLLTILDVDRETIYEDYLLTNEYRKDSIEKLVQYAKSKGMPEEYIPQFMAVDGVLLQNFIDGIEAVEKEYGSLLNYIHEALHISNDEINILKNRYLV